MRFTTFLLIMAIAVLFGQCKKSGSDNGVLIAKYHITGTCKYVFDAFNQYWETDALDTASFAMEKPVSPDSSGFVYLNGVAWNTDHGGYCLSFVPDGVRIAAQLADTTLKIPLQYPYPGGGLSIEGTGSYVNKKVTLQYHTHYRGFHKYATVSGLP